MAGVERGAQPSTAVELVHGDAAAWLEAAPAGSFDAVVAAITRGW